MTIKQFLKENRKQIDSIIMEYYGERPSSDADRFEWILNDQGLYAWAHQEGVNI